MQTLSRMNLCALLTLAPVAPISARLVALQVVEHKNYSSRVQNETERHMLEIIPRGRILDRESRVLAESLPSWSSYLDLNAMTESRKVARAVAPLLGLKQAEVLAKTRTKRRTAWLKRKMTLEEMLGLKSLKLPCIGIVADEQRFYPNGELARSVLGSVGSDGKGNAGLEFEFDRRLSGRSQKVELTRDGAGKAILQDLQDKVAAPPDITLTIDRTIQFFAESAIQEAVVKHHARRGIVLVQDPRSGDILAMAVYPAEPLRNGAIQDVYEPGSTFKIVMAAAALENHALGPSERVDCEGGRWALSPSVTIKDHETQGPLTLAEIIQYSSNIGAAKLGLRLGPEVFDRFCRLFGFGYKTGIQFPGESAGLLKILNPGRGQAHEKSQVGIVRLANAAFGQGIAVTPLQLIGAYSAVANGGDLMEPRLILAVGAQNAPNPMRLRQVINPTTARALRDMLELVVEKGTGVTAQISGYRAAGKTGTAQKLDPATGHYSTSDYVSSFAGYAPAQDPRFTLLVVVDSPRGQYYGAEVAAPVFAKLTKQILAWRGIAPDLPLPLRPSGQKPSALRLQAKPGVQPGAPKTRPDAPAPSRLPKPSILKGTG